MSRHPDEGSQSQESKLRLKEDIEMMKKKGRRWHHRDEMRRVKFWIDDRNFLTRWSVNTSTVIAILTRDHGPATEGISLPATVLHSPFDESFFSVKRFLLMKTLMMKS
ncbi:hypothetical protein L1987_23140 [Smallanthus sonchifolius]|uniref:Uncharacterized protein n=1 Tax=Smallanthus sonchifolius TaxID=185202 RepID=A0ACB9III7_9ASTR|nr:hypothetical protein L1987_23140 [Smallanthus sonchifolius]